MWKFKKKLPQTSHMGEDTHNFTVTLSWLLELSFFCCSGIVYGLGHNCSQPPVEAWRAGSLVKIEIRGETLSVFGSDLVPSMADS